MKDLKNNIPSRHSLVFIQYTCIFTRLEHNPFIGGYAWRWGGGEDERDLSHTYLSEIKICMAHV